MGVSTLSAWENVRTPTIPSQRRLAAYARFFATERSLEDHPHLIPPTELTDAEDETRRELERELFRLRDEDVGEPPPSPHESWRFDDGFPINIICSELGRSDEFSRGPLSDGRQPELHEAVLLRRRGRACRVVWSPQGEQSARADQLSARVPVHAGKT